MRRIFAVLLLLAVGTPSFPAEPIKRSVHDLIDCAGHALALSDYMTTYGKTSDAKTQQDVARGGYLSAGFLMVVFGKINNMEAAVAWARALAEVRRKYWNFVADQRKVISGRDVLPKEFTDKIFYCRDAVNPIQGDILNIIYNRSK